MLAKKTLAVVGVGKLGEALISGLLKNSSLAAEDITGSVGKTTSVERVEKKLGIKVSQNNIETVKGKDIILLAVKPQNMDRVLKELKETITPNQLVISVAASVTSSFVQERLKEGVPVVRAMPNTPSVINAGMAGLCAGIHANAEQIAVAEAIFKCVGETVFVDESLMDAVTALSASGPAYLYVVVESLAEAGVKLGIPRETATLLAAQTMFGSLCPATIGDAAHHVRRPRCDCRVHGGV